MRIDLSLLGSVASHRAAEAGAKVEAMHDRYRRDIASAVESKSAVDGKAAAPRLALQERRRVYQGIADAVNEILLEEAAAEAAAAS